MRTKEPWNRSGEQLVGHVEKDSSSGTSGVTPPPIWPVRALYRRHPLGQDRPKEFFGLSGIRSDSCGLNRVIAIVGRAGWSRGTEGPPASDYDSRRTTNPPGKRPRVPTSTRTASPESRFQSGKKSASSA